MMKVVAQRSLIWVVVQVRREVLHDVHAKGSGRFRRIALILTMQVYRDVSTYAAQCSLHRAKEFPQSEVVGIDVCRSSAPDSADLPALQPEYELIAPPNSFFSVVDVTQGLPFPDKSCTLIYSRWMMAGVSSNL